MAIPTRSNQGEGVLFMSPYEIIMVVLTMALLVVEILKLTSKDSNKK